jgi:hypothetical protein
MLKSVTAAMVTGTSIAMSSVGDFRRVITRVTVDTLATTATGANTRL